MPQRYIHKNGTSKLDKRCKQYKSQKKAAGIAKRTRKKKSCKKIAQQVDSGPGLCYTIEVNI